MEHASFEKLYAEALISDASFNKIEARKAGRLFSVHWELKVLLYLGVLLLSSGAGILVYKNIDTLGHQVILLMIGLVTASCFLYCIRTKSTFSTGRVASPNAFFDYILLLGCLGMLGFIGYIQFQYNIFGNRFGLAVFIPMVILFISAYYFDQLGVLSLAITHLAAWAGIVLTPTRLLKENDFNSATLVYTGLALGALLVLAGAVSRQRQLKAHFTFTYSNFGAHLLFVAGLSAMFHFEHTYLLWFLPVGVAAFYFYREAYRIRSFYFILILTLYTYTGLSYIVLRLLLWHAADNGSFYLSFLYFILSGVGLILFLMRTNKQLKQHDSL